MLNIATTKAVVLNQEVIEYQKKVNEPLQKTHKQLNFYISLKKLHICPAKTFKLSKQQDILFGGKCFDTR